MKLILKRKYQRGQALLLVLLAMAAIMTVVMSVASRSITDVSISTSEEDALRAFSAAEAGIEKALYNGSFFVNPNPVVPGDFSSTFTSRVTQSSEGDAFTYPNLLLPGESATFWLVERTQDGGFTCAGGSCFSGIKIKDLCWGAYPSSSYSAGEKPAVLLSVFYDWSGTGVGNLTNSGGADFSNIKITRRGYDPDSVRTSSNHFYDVAPGSCKIKDTDFAFHTGDLLFKDNSANNRNEIGLPGQACWNTPGCLIMIKVRVFYNDVNKPEQIGLIMGGGNEILPAQGSRIESTGTAGGSTRKVNVFQSFSEPPSIFDTAVFSLGDFSK